MRSVCPRPTATVTVVVSTPIDTAPGPTPAKPLRPDSGVCVPDTPVVPHRAETIITYVCPTDRLEAVLGDLEERFAQRVVNCGEKAARHWYWWQAIRSVTAFLFRTAQRGMLFWELLEKLGL